MGDDLKTKGFLDIPIDFSLDLFAEIIKLKKDSTTERKKNRKKPSKK